MEPVMDESLLDLACGPAHVALFFAPFVRGVVGYDLADEMLRAAAQGARAKSVTRFAPVRGDVHRLPFADRSFDLVTCRASAHHFSDPAAVLAEARRVLRRGGRLGVVDGMAPDDDQELDAFVNDLDRLHDPTTVRNHRPSEWRAMIEGVGLRVDALETDLRERPAGASLANWIARAGGTTAVYEEARRRRLGAPARVRAWLKVEERADDVGFDLPKLLVVARRVD
jgi:ubiquinone/menaquinone biosynthesis C-methylase UbiE